LKIDLKKKKVLFSNVRVFLLCAQAYSHHRPMHDLGYAAAAAGMSGATAASRFNPATQYGFFMHHHHHAAAAAHHHSHHQSHQMARTATGRTATVPTAAGLAGSSSSSGALGQREMSIEGFIDDAILQSREIIDGLEHAKIKITAFTISLFLYFKQSCCNQQSCWVRR
jgi:hypothetical protein